MLNAPKCSTSRMLNAPNRTGEGHQYAMNYRSGPLQPIGFSSFIGLLESPSGRLFAFRPWHDQTIGSPHHCQTSTAPLPDRHHTSTIPAPHRHQTSTAPSPHQHQTSTKPPTRKNSRFYYVKSGGIFLFFTIPARKNSRYSLYLAYTCLEKSRRRQEIPMFFLGNHISVCLTQEKVPRTPKRTRTVPKNVKKGTRLGFCHSTFARNQAWGLVSIYFWSLWHLYRASQSILGLLLYSLLIGLSVMPK